VTVPGTVAPQPPVASGSAEAAARQVVALLERLGQSERGEVLSVELARPPSGTPVVVVAGEDKRGKSTLVDALLGRPELSHVGVEVVTAAPITFHYSEEEAAEVYWYGSEAAEPMGVAEACALATVEGAPVGDRAIAGVRVGLPSPLLTDMDLVDTPGVGGLESGHAALTLQSLAQADALVFVLEAGAQVGAGELDFLHKAAARIQSVVLVVTKVDRYRGWRTVLDDNLAILTDKAPRFARCPVVPVSAALALRGAASGNAEDAAAMAEESGLVLLASTLKTEVVDRRAVLTEANLARAGLSAVTGAEQALAGRLLALSPDEGTREALRREQQRLAALQDDKANWPHVLELGVRKLTIDHGDEVSRGVADIRHRYEARLKKAKPKEIKTYPGELVADLVALAGRIGEFAIARLSDIVVELLKEVDAADDLQSSLDQLTHGQVEADLARLQLTTSSFTLSDRLSVISGFSSGHSIATLIVGSSGFLTAGFLTGGIAIALGLGFGGVYAFENFRARRKQLLETEFTDWMKDQCTEAQRAIKSNFSLAIIDIQEELKGRIKEALAECEKDVNEALAAARQAFEGGEAARQREHDTLEQSLAELRSLKAQEIEVLRSLGVDLSGAGAGPGAGQPAVTAPATAVIPDGPSAL
jgi:hypothetical protein